MIKIESFYLFPNFWRETQEFYDDKVVVNRKSLKTDYEFETKYSEIKGIQHWKNANTSQAFFGLFVAIILGFVFTALRIFFSGLLEISIILRTGQAIFFIGVILYLSGLIKSNDCYFRDKNNDFITSIKINSKNKEDANKAIDLVKQKSPYIDETNPDDPFPKLDPLFEFIDYDIPDFLNKSTTRFYETELIDNEKGLTEEVVTRVKYSELNKKIIRAKRGNDNWNSIGRFLGYSGLMISASSWVFRFPKVINAIAEDIFWVLLTTALISFLLMYIKEEIIYFYNNANRVVYWMKVTRTNKEKVEQILQFIQSKISTDPESTASIK